MQGSCKLIDIAKSLALSKSSDKLEHNGLGLNHLNAPSRPSLLLAWYLYAIRLQYHDHLHKVKRAEHVADIQLRWR